MPCNNGYFSVDPTEYSVNDNGNRQLTFSLNADEVGYQVVTITSVSNVWDVRELEFRIAATVSPVFRMGVHIQDMIMVEDGGEQRVTDLDSVFITSYRGSVQYATPACVGLIPRIARNGEFFLSPRPNWNGISDVIITATVPDTNFAQLADTFRVTVTPRPDPPGHFDLLTPLDGATVHPTESDTLFVWQSSRDVDGDTVRYTLFVYPENADDTARYEDLLDTTFTTLVLPEIMDHNVDGRFFWTVIATDGGLEQPAWSSFGNYLSPAAVGVDLMPIAHRLVEVYPNPFNGVLTVKVNVIKRGMLKVSILDISGRLVDVLSEQFIEKGVHAFPWQSLNAASGDYLIKVEADGTVSFHPVVLTR
jgi:hypothetical protein